MILFNLSLLISIFSLDLTVADVFVVSFKEMFSFASSPIVLIVLISLFSLFFSFLDFVLVLSLSFRKEFLGFLRLDIKSMFTLFVYFLSFHHQTQNKL